MTGADGIGRQLAVTGLLVTLLVSGIGAVAVSGPTGPTPEEPPDRRDVGSLAALYGLHDAGYTGENVTVGVVDVTGFDPDHPALSERVAVARSFAPDDTIENGGRNEHGTAAAAAVARAAPNASLYLASFDTADGYESAVDWLVERNVDVIVAPVSFYGKPGDGSSRVSRVAARAVNRGVVFVAPVGNVRDGHWQGRFDPVRGGTHLFKGGTRNHLSLGDGRELTLWLSWPREERHHDFTLELHWTNGDDSRFVARSQPYRFDAVPNERIVATVNPNGAYYFVVRGPRNAAGVDVDVVSPTHTFQFSEPAGSVQAPATARSVVAVGAYDDRTGRAEPFSSTGPMAGGRLGVDVVAPDRLPAAGDPTGFVGSSAAAPHVAGVVALMLDANPDLEPQRVEEVLTGTAADVSDRGVDSVSGHGHIDPIRAVARAENATG